MSKIFKNKKRIACLLLGMVLLLSGTLTYLFESSKDKGIISEAGWYPYGVTNVGAAGQSFNYVIDASKIYLGGDYGWIPADGGLTGGLYYSYDESGNLCIRMSGTVGGFGSYHIGEWTTGKGNTYQIYSRYVSGSVKICFPKAVVNVSNFNDRYDLWMEISGIWAEIRNCSKPAVDPIICGNSGNRFWFQAYSDSGQSDVGFKYSVHMWVNEAPTNGNVLNIFKDLDQPAIIGSTANKIYGCLNIVDGATYYPADLMQEGITPGSGCITDVDGLPNVFTNGAEQGGSTLNILSNQYGYPNVVGTCATGGDGEPPEIMSTMSFLGGAQTGWIYEWSGTNCGTALGIYLNDTTIFQQVNVTTNVYYQNKDGEYDFGATADTSTIIKGAYYSYTWPYDYSTNTIYYNGDFTVGNYVSEDTVFNIYVPRRSYTYRFDFDTYCPSGHTSDEINNKQGEFTKLAENNSEVVKRPTLTGYTFLGFFDADGNEYTPEQMLSNKTFYAKWRKNKYKVHYDGNGDTNYNHQTGEYTQNTVKGTMADSTFYYDTTGKLRKNKFTREGYIFRGWSKRANGAGSFYPDEYDEVLNWTTKDYDTDGDAAVITLYAQWTKVLGDETITVVSEETGNPVKDVSMTLQKNVNGTWKDITSETTSAGGQIKVSDLHWFDYRWVMTDVPDGYVISPDTTFTIKPCGTCDESDCTNFHKTNRVILYMKHVDITIVSRVDCIIDGEDPPAFMYHISGNDVAGVKHEYNVLVQTSKSSKVGSKSLIHDIFAGTYTITQVSVSRYKPGTAISVGNMTVNGINATANLVKNTAAAVQFPYTLTNHGWYYGVDSKSNQLRK